MNKPESVNDFCELCNEEFILIKSSQDRGDLDTEWEQVTIKYEREWYWNPLAARGWWLEYTICPTCFLHKIVPKLIELGLPKKEFGGYIS